MGVNRDIKIQTIRHIIDIFIQKEEREDVKKYELTD